MKGLGEAAGVPQPNDTEPGFEQFEVEADVGIRAWGPTRADAFAQAALGVLSLIADPATVSPRETREVRAQADSPETLLVAWIDECLYVHEIEAFVVSRVELVSCSDTIVIGQLHGEPLEAGRHRLGTVVKAATLHGVAVDARDGRHEVRIIVDV
jgi:tRNA nucleotidyltransferase (CCA-adding enzyme)